MSTEFVTGTGERYRRRGRYVDVGLSQSAQDALGTALLFAPVSIGAKVCAGEHLFVLEGDKAAA